jgi:hypothetical protein
MEEPAHNFITNVSDDQLDSFTGSTDIQKTMTKED